MKIVVTGGAGFIGSNIVDALIEERHEVVCIDNESSTANEKFYWNPKCIKVVEDICDYEAILPYFYDVDIVFHLAAEARIQPAIENPTLAAKTNVVGTCNVLQAARHSGVSRVIYSSTSSAYGLKNKVPHKEDMSTDCLNPYSVTKVAGEELCKMYNRLFGLNTVIFRYFNVYGERQPIKGQYAPVVGIFQRQVKNKEAMTIVGDGLQRRDFTHVSDVVNANMLAAKSENPDIFGEIFNIGTGQNVNMIELANMIDSRSDTRHIPARLGESRETLADISKATKLLKWKPKVKLEDWI